jgi:AraC-like DNA-binding protein
MAADLITMTTRFASKPGMHATPSPSLQIIRADAEYERVHSTYKPSLCFIVQGTKVVTVGEEVLRYGQNQFMYSSVELPVTGEVTVASRRHPYLVLVLEITPDLVFELVTASEAVERRKPAGSQQAIFVGEDAAMTESFTRLMQHLSRPVDAQVLAPMTIREIVYRLLRTPYGDAVREIGIADSQTQRIAVAIERLKRDYTGAVSMTALARVAGMSVSSFHAHFKKVTTLTPLQYQKHLRLREARRLLLTSATSAAEAGFAVGYESASQFSREYARYFGLPPLSDARRTSKAAKV